MKEKKYQCDQCGEFFKTANALGAHKRLKHGTQVEKVDTNALLDLFRDIKTDLEKLKESKSNIGNTEKEGVKTLPGTNVKEGFDGMSQSVVQAVSSILKRVDRLEQRLGDSENSTAQATMDGFGKLLERIDKLEERVEEKEKSSPSNGVTVKNEEDLKARLQKLQPLLKRHGLDILIKGSGDEKKAVVKQRATTYDFGVGKAEEQEKERQELRKAVQKLLPLMNKWNIEIRRAKLVEKSKSKF